jgi:hypothetical protein
MKKLEALKSPLFEKFKDFALTKEQASQIVGGRTVHYDWVQLGADSAIYGCQKTVDTNEGQDIKYKIKHRYDDKCPQ